MRTSIVISTYISWFSNILHISQLNMKNKLKTECSEKGTGMVTGLHNFMLQNKKIHQLTGAI
jgi:hypothetical protein